MAKTCMPDTLTIYTPAGQDLTVYRITDDRPAYDPSESSSITRTMVLAAIGYALESLATDEDGDMTAGEQVYRECAMSCGSLYLGDFEGYFFEEPDGEDGTRIYCVRAVDFIQSVSGPRCVLDIWDKEADTSAHYDY